MRHLIFAAAVLVTAIAATATAGADPTETPATPTPSATETASRATSAGSQCQHSSNPPAGTHQHGTHQHGTHQHLCDGCGRRPPGHLHGHHHQRPDRQYLLRLGRSAGPGVGQQARVHASGAHPGRPGAPWTAQATPTTPPSGRSSAPAVGCGSTSRVPLRDRRRQGRSWCRSRAAVASNAPWPW